MDPGSLQKDPGVLRKGTGIPLKHPGALDNYPRNPCKVNYAMLRSAGNRPQDSGWSPGLKDPWFFLFCFVLFVFGFFCFVLFCFVLQLVVYFVSVCTYLFVLFVYLFVCLVCLCCLSRKAPGFLSPSRPAASKSRRASLCPGRTRL